MSSHVFPTNVSGFFLFLNQLLVESEKKNQLEATRLKIINVTEKVATLRLIINLASAIFCMSKLPQGKIWSIPIIFLNAVVSHRLYNAYQLARNQKSILLNENDYKQGTDFKWAAVIKKMEENLLITSSFHIYILMITKILLRAVPQVSSEQFGDALYQSTQQLMKDLNYVRS